MEYIVSGKNIKVFQPDFDLAETLDCGQAFRWEATADGFAGHFLNRFLEITKEKDYFVFRNTSEADFLNVWAEYFDFSTDYGELKRLFSQDAVLEKACKYAGGIRLLKQDLWEALVSFIISQNNNIPRIKGIISRLCSENGFPTAEKLAGETPETLGYLRSGFRAKYLVDAAKKVSAGEVDLKAVSVLPIEEARTALKTISGVGPKVAECVLLYGMYRVEAFPVDVWIKRVLAEYYPDGFPKEFSQYAGIAQQYLFHYIRNNFSK